MRVAEVAGSRWELFPQSAHRPLSGTSAWVETGSLPATWPSGSDWPMRMVNSATWDEEQEMEKLQCMKQTATSNSYGHSDIQNLWYRECIFTYCLLRPERVILLHWPAQRVVLPNGYLWGRARSGWHNLLALLARCSRGFGPHSSWSTSSASQVSEGGTERESFHNGLCSDTSAFLLNIAVLLILLGLIVITLSKLFQMKTSFKQTKAL